MKKFNGNTIIERNEAEFISSLLGDDIVLMNTVNGDYVGMNAVGTDIWHLLKAPLNADEIITRVINMYEIDEQQGREKLNAFLQVMLDHQVIFISKGPLSEVSEIG
jgi:hypothetical protein